MYSDKLTNQSLSDFGFIRKYSKYSLNLTFGWEYNDTLFLRTHLAPAISMNC